MEREIFGPSTEKLTKTQLVARLTQEEKLLVGAQRYRILSAPVFFANELVDFLMLDRDNHPVVVHVFESLAEAGKLPVLMSDYAQVLRHLEKLKRLFQDITWAQPTRLRLLFLAPHFAETFMQLVSLLQADVILAEFETIESDERQGLVLREKMRTFEAKGTQQLDALFSVLAENVKSDSQAASYFAVSAGSSLQRSEQDAFSFFEKAKLSEEELVSFLDFEKKVSEWEEAKRQHAENQGP